MRNIKEYQNNILALNNKCLKYSSLSKEDILKKYKEENKKNLEEKNKSLENMKQLIDSLNKQRESSEDSIKKRKK